MNWKVMLGRNAAQPTTIRARLGLISIALMMICHGAHADTYALAPSQVFVRFGSGEDSVHSVTAGATWNWRWQRYVSRTSITGYTELAFGRWSISGADETPTRDTTVVGVTPVFKFSPPWAGRRVFIESGIGFNFLTHNYRNGHTRFSTSFNFGDHIGVGYRFGRFGQNSAVLRVEHFSNGGIKEPNPGANFLQLQWSIFPGFVQTLAASGVDPIP